MICKCRMTAWQAVFSMPIDFGDVVWGGNVLGSYALLVGNRGDKDLVLICRISRDLLIMENAIINKDIGPIQIAVIHE